MTLAELNTALNTVCPAAYEHFPKDAGDIYCPFCVFYSPGVEYFNADNINYHGKTPVTVELYTEYKDADVEAAIEAVLPQPFTKMESYIDDDLVFLITYETEVK